jgi:hypothetical protein
MTTAKDVTKEAPRSPCTRMGDYVIMARMIDKGRAILNGTAEEYHFGCPFDQMLFNSNRIPRMSGYFCKTRAGFANGEVTEASCCDL